jgi:hypothetical protein
MPFKSQKQRNLMHAVENDPAVAAKTGISQDVAAKFTAHDPGGKLPKYAPSHTGILSKNRQKKKKKLGKLFK